MSGLSGSSSELLTVSSAGDFPSFCLRLLDLDRHNGLKKKEPFPLGEVDGEFVRDFEFVFAGDWGLSDLSCVASLAFSASLAFLATLARC